MWALAKLVENGLFQLDRGDLVNQTVMALLPQVQTPSGTDFTSQHDLQPAVGAGETGGERTDSSWIRERPGQPGGDGAVVAGAVDSSGTDLTSQDVSNLLWALAKLVENGRLQMDRAIW